MFLGSNSQKTVEYFSKALGEKTISHYSISTNRDKGHHKTGYSNSDQIMARALMTPDELRRMDNDLCIIFEKGIRPIKANKFYYFKKPMAKELQKYEISHNDIGDIERGKWRKYNPYNPYVEEGEEQKKTQDLKIESLDDLFEDDTDENIKKEEQKKNETREIKTPKIEKDKSKTDEIFEEETKSDKSTIEDKQSDSPTLPMAEEYDLQKELEAKFDELFGPIDDN